MINRRTSMKLLGGAAAAAAATKLLSATPSADGIKWFSTTQTERWRSIKGLAFAAPSANPFNTDVIIHHDLPQQRIDGFGGAFTELGWDALMKLAPARRDAAMTAHFFGTGGCDQPWPHADWRERYQPQMV